MLLGMLVEVFFYCWLVLASDGSLTCVCSPVPGPTSSPESITLTVAEPEKESAIQLQREVY